MQVVITCRHGNIPPDVRDHIEKKSEKLLTYFERITEIEVTVDFENTHLIKVEILVDAEHRHDFIAKEEGGEVLPVFDAALSKVEHQIKKYKSKIQDHRRDPRTNEVVPETVGDDEESDQ